MLKGIDVSRWQGYINWQIVKQNVNFAMIKIGGSDDGFYQDGMAVRNVLEARALGIPIGFYIYLGGSHSPSEEVTHIKNLFYAIGGLHVGEIIALDWEERNHDEVGYLTGIVEGMGRAGFPTPFIYMSASRITGNDWSPLVTRQCPLWVAAWGNNNAIPEPNENPFVQEWGRWMMWQYSSTGSVAGIAGRVDLNNFAGTVEDFKSFGLRSGVSVTAPSTVSTVFPSQPLTGEYIVQPNDSLSAIASRFGRTWQDLWAMNRDRVSQPNRIFVGQKLRVWQTVNNEIVQPAPEVQKPNPLIPTPTHQPRTHIVRNGESLSVIAAKYGLPSWTVLYNLNKSIIGSDPNRIFPDQVLQLP